LAKKVYEKSKTIWTEATFGVSWEPSLGDFLMASNRFFVHGLDETRMVYATMPRLAALFFIELMKAESKEIGVVLMVTEKPFTEENGSFFLTEELLNGPPNHTMRLCI
jgi:hypothetical protein